MSYTPPLGNAANVTWVGAPAYTPPLGNAANVTWQTDDTPAAVEGTAAAVVFALALTGAATAAFGVGAVTGVASAQVASLAITGTVTAQLAAAGSAAGTIPFATGISPAITAQHPRYELRGQVRLAGVPVERRVRAYARSTGALLGQGDTTGGFFRIAAGFAEIECTVLPIDLDAGATDYEPPTANRVLCALAEDAA